MADMRNENEFLDNVVVVTGGASGIGKCTARMFHDRGAKVCILDVAGKAPDAAATDLYFQGDIADEKILLSFADKVLSAYGHVDFLINNAPPLFKGISDCTYENFNCALRVGVAAPFFLTKLFMDYFGPGAAIVNISSSRDRMSQPQSESYSAAKGGIYALTHALAMSLAGKVRVNSISPGWIDSRNEGFDGADAVQHPAGRVGRPEDITNMILFLCSEKAGFITGENVCIDGGMTRQMIYNDDFGWSYKP